MLPGSLLIFVSPHNSLDSLWTKNKNRFKQSLEKGLLKLKIEFFLTFFHFFACNIGAVVLQGAHDK